MNRRELLRKAGLNAVIGAVTLKVVPSLAQSSTTESTLIGEIGANHGHEIPTITGEELMALARDLSDNETTKVDIKGRSNHPHSILLSKENIGALLIGEELELVSVGGSHNHTVNLVLEKN